MQPMRVYRDRRTFPATVEQAERRAYCWTLEKCDEQVRATCHAFIVQENCWDFWVLKGARYKGCCHRLENCQVCPIVLRKFAETVPVYVRVPRPPLVPTLPLTAPPQTAPGGRAGRRHEAKPTCEQLQFRGGEMPQEMTLRWLRRESQEHGGHVFRCRRRGVYLDEGYTADVCLSRLARQCVFL